MTAKPKLYLETSIVSYLTARPSHELILAAHQQVTRDWWEVRAAFDLYISLRGALLLDLTPEAGRLAREILVQGGMPAKAYVDAVHVALSAAHGLDYLLTWNCTHIANATMRGKIESICRAAGFEPPVICTPIELVKEL